MSDLTSHPRFPRVAGIVGGLGPFAHLHLERRLLELARRRFAADADADFPDWVVSSMPQTPDRTEALTAGGPDPTPFLLRSLARVAGGGAHFAAIACNTMHAFLPRLADGLPLPVVHAVLETRDHLRRHHPDVRRVGLLATAGTVRSGLFPAAFGLTDINVLAPNVDDQRRLVTEAIYGPPDGGIKGGALDAANPRPRELLLQAAGQLIEQHEVGAILVACSEISLAVADGDLPVPVVDTMEVLAEVTLELAAGTRSLDSLHAVSDWPTAST